MFFNTDIEMVNNVWQQFQNIFSVGIIQIDEHDIFSYS